MVFHIWDIYNPNKISVDITPKLKNDFKKKIAKDIYSIARKINILPVRLYDYFIYQHFPVPLNVLIKLSILFNISLINLEKEIIMYKQMFVPIKNSIKKPNLPIKIHPYLTSIISHFYFDGSLPNDGKGAYYNQKEKSIMNDFINKIKFVFGDVKYSLLKDHRGVLKCRIPRIIGEVCKDIYKIQSFGCFDSKISDFIFSLNIENKISFVLTAILDEGSIAYDGTIFFGVSNKRLCEGVRLLCHQIGLETSTLKKSSKTHYYFHIISRTEFLKILWDFKKKYPLINLGYKEKRLEKYFEIKKKKIFYTKEFSYKRTILILDELGKRESSINNLSINLLMPPRTIRRYMYKFIKENKVQRKKVKNEYIYFLL